MNPDDEARFHASFIHHPRVPYGLREGLVRYAAHGIPTGGFLRACLENDLIEACGRADEESALALKPIMQWIYNEAPSSCWKSKERVDAWIAKHAPKRAPYDGPIEEGMRFLWEGDKAISRCVVRVTGFGQVDGERTVRAVVEQVGPQTINSVGDNSWNEESRFREAVVPFVEGKS